MPNDYDQNAIKELLAAGKAIGATVPPGFAPVAIVPEGYTVEPLSLAAETPLPSHIIQRVTLQDVASFTAYVKRHADAATLIFSDAKVNPNGSVNASFEAIFDYHHAQKEGMCGANHCGHRARYACVPSAEWTAWTGISGRALKQSEFIDFVEQNVPDIVSPASATVMELATKFEATTSVEFSSKKDRMTGGVQLTYKETVDAGAPTTGGKIQCFDRLKLQMPVFEGGEMFDLEARVEWRPADGKLTVLIVLQRPHEVVREALDSIRLDIEANTGFTPLAGSI